MRLQGKELLDDLLRQLDEGHLSEAEKAILRCRLSKEFEDIGNYEAAQGILGALWRRVGERPKVDGLDEETQAVVLLRVGALTGLIGQAKQIEGAQEQALDLLTESHELFVKHLDAE